MKMIKELLARHIDLAEAKTIAKRVEITKGEFAGKSGTIREIKNGAFKGATKFFFIDLDDGRQANNLPGTSFKILKDEMTGE